MNFPLPVATIEAQALKSMSRSLVSPAPMVKFPPAIWPEGIFRPLCASLVSVKAWTLLSAESITQLAGLPGKDEH
jgi:hypothetical protein